MKGLKWAVGIEHEYNLRFENLICSGKDKLSKKILNTADWNSTYLFVNTRELLDMYKNHIKLIFYNNIDLVKKIDNKFANKIETDIESEKVAKKLAKNKRRLPTSMCTNIHILLKYAYWYRYWHYPKTIFDYVIDINNWDKRISLSFIDYLYSKIINKDGTIISDSVKFSEKDIVIAERLIHDNDFYKKWDTLIKQKMENGLTNSIITKINNVRDNVCINKDKYIFNNIYISVSENKKWNLKLNIKHLNEYIKSETERTNPLNKIEITVKNEKILRSAILMYKNDQPITDTSFIENKSINYFKKSYIQAHRELTEQEDTLLNIFSKLPELQPYIQKFGKIVQHNIGATENQVILDNIKECKLVKIDVEYCGSYHIWNTLFYYDKTTPNQFTNECITYGNCIQMLEPFFAAHFTTPPSNAMGNSLQHSRMSQRGLLNISANYGTSDLSLLKGCNNSQIEKLYMKTENISKHKYLDFYWHPPKYAKVYDIQTQKIVKYYSALNDRFFTSNNYNILLSPDYTKHYTDQKYKIENYIEKILKTSNIDLIKEIGADFRTLWWEKNIVPPLKKNWEQVHVLKKNKIYAYYVNTITNEIIDTPPYDEKKFENYLKKSRIGLEFRILDHMKTEYLVYPLSIISLVSVHAHKNTINIEAKDLIINNQIWHNEMVNVIKDGFSYQPSKKYLSFIEKEFQINFKDNENINTEQFFELFVKQLTRKYGDTNELRKIFPKKYIPKKFPSMNKNAWLGYLYDKITQDKELRQKIKSLYQVYRNREISDSNIQEILGKEWIYDKDKIIVFIENNKNLFS